MLEKIKKPIFAIPMSFIIVILTGSLLLSLPAASESGKATPFVDSFFTATSATCVTGLLVVDTADYWSLFGELVILGMIQIGGFGLVTLLIYIMSLRGHKTNLQSMMLARGSVNGLNMQETFPLIRKIFNFVLVAESIGALFLSFFFIFDQKMPFFKGLYYGIFYSVSAFCSAGFDLSGGFSSLYGFGQSPFFLLSISTLVILGGFGFIIWQDMLEYRKTRRMMVHTRLVLLLTAAFIIAGTLFIYVVEHNQALLPYTGWNKLLNAFFLSVNTRSAGFATFDVNTLQSTTKVFLSFLMLIGGASGSTAGGIKINTFGIIIVTIISVVRSNNEVVLFKKVVPYSTIMKAFCIAIMAILLVFSVTLFLNLIHPEWSLVNILFEVSSSFGTAGLSTGIPPLMGIHGKMLLTLTMLAGRIGAITFILMLENRQNKHDTTFYPDGKFIVG